MKKKKWVNGKKNEWKMNEWMKEEIHEWKNEWMIEWMIEWMYGWTNQRVKWIDDLSFSFSNQIENVNPNESQLAWCDESASRACHQQKQRARQ